MIIWMATESNDHSPPVGVPLMSALFIPVLTQFTAVKGSNAPINKANVGQWFSCAWQKKPLRPELKSVWSQRGLSTDTGGLINWTWLGSTERKIQCGTRTLTAEAEKYSHLSTAFWLQEELSWRGTDWILKWPTWSSISSILVMTTASCAVPYTYIWDSN